MLSDALAKSLEVKGSAMPREARKTLLDLLTVMAALRTPGSGCPWDLEQTFQTIAPYTIEEAYEVAEAIAGGDRDELLEELGDVLFVIANLARHLRIDPEASLRGANAKFVRRFRRIEELLAAAGRSPSEATLVEMERAWEEAKAEERRPHRAQG